MIIWISHITFFSKNVISQILFYVFSLPLLTEEFYPVTQCTVTQSHWPRLIILPAFRGHFESGSRSFKINLLLVQPFCHAPAPTLNLKFTCLLRHCCISSARDWWPDCPRLWLPLGAERKWESIALRVLTNQREVLPGQISNWDNIRGLVWNALTQGGVGDEDH